ncbi:MAG: hypothetical protein FWF51_02645 [Chitinivibrionia bacterium]|nr:hypothetical protein [Chitinivibrionia bacterium]
MKCLSKKSIILSVFVFVAYSADTHLGDGVYLLDKTVDPTSSVVKVAINSQQLEKLLTKDYDNADDKRALVFEKELWNITKNKIYSKFNDDFDYIFYVLNGTNTGQLRFEGRKMSVRIDYENTSLYTRKGNVADYYEEWGSDNKLKSVFYFPRYDAIKDGPSLHEFAHHWGAEICEDTPGHWGASSAGGQLGGFKYVRKIGEEKYQGSMNATFTDGFGRDGYRKNAYPYSDIELYLMGFKSAQDLRDANFKLDVYLNNGSAPSVSNDGTFSANKINSYTIDDLMKSFDGKERDPNFLESPKTFKILTVFLSPTDDEGQTIFDSRANKVVEDVVWFGEKTAYAGGYYNFYQATGGVGSIDVSGIKNSVKFGIVSVKKEKSQNKKHGIFCANPVGDKAEINIKIPEKSKFVKFSVFDNLGNVIFNSELRGLELELKTVWNLKNISGKKVAAGTYFALAEVYGISGKIYRYDTKIGVKN